MKFLFDFFPILLFFISYKFGSHIVPADQVWLKENPIYLATIVAIVASILQVAFNWFKTRKFETMHLVSLVLIVVFGGATLYLKDPLFIKWKPTILNWLFGIVFLGSQFFMERPIIQKMLGQQIELPPQIWFRLNMIWVAFFALVGAANLYVAYRYDEATWVNFKLFGMLGLTFAFVILQSFYLTRYIKEPDSEV